MRDYLKSKEVRASFTRSELSATQSTKPRRAGNKLFPIGVNSYFTRGGTSAKSSLMIRPSRSKLRNVRASILSDIVGIDLFYTENLARSPGSMDRASITKILHLFPTFGSSSRKVIGSSWPQRSPGISYFFLRCALTYLHSC